MRMAFVSASRMEIGPCDSICVARRIFEDAVDLAVIFREGSREPLGSDCLHDGVLPPLKCHADVLLEFRVLALGAQAVFKDIRQCEL